MLEVVLTHPQYRRRGFIRAQIDQLHQMCEDRDYDLNIIWGIPYYYRQYGYSYALDLLGADILPAENIPAPQSDERNPYSQRGATADDIPTIAKLHEESTAALQLTDFRNLDYWRFLLGQMQYPVQVVVDSCDDSIVGYVCIDRESNQQETKVLESAASTQAVAMFILSQLKSKCSENIRLSWPQENTLVQLSRSLGSTALPNQQWFLRIGDIPSLLLKISPVLERRLAASTSAGFTGDFYINLYTQAFMLQFKDGKLLKVDPIGFKDYSNDADGGDICVPQDVFTRLVFGYRSLDEMRDSWPDICVKPQAQPLVDALFPKMTSYFSMPWQYYGRDARRDSNQ